MTGHMIHRGDIEAVNLSDLALAGGGYINPRYKINVKDVEDLKDSIKATGLQETLTVWEPEGPEVEGEPSLIIIDGQLRYTALTEMIAEGDLPEDTQVYVCVHHGPLLTVKVDNLSSHFTRKDLSPADSARAIYELYKEVGNQTATAELLGVSQGWVSQQAILWGSLCTAAQELFSAEGTTAKTAKALSKLVQKDGIPDEPAQLAAIAALQGDPIVTDTVEMLGADEKPKKKTRGKAAFQELELSVRTALGDESFAELHARMEVLLDVCEWYKGDIEFEEVFTGYRLSESVGDEVTESTAEA